MSWVLIIPSLLSLCVSHHTVPLSGQFPLLSVFNLLYRFVSMPTPACLEGFKNFKTLWAVCNERFHETSQFWVTKGVLHVRIFYTEQRWAGMFVLIRWNRSPWCCSFLLEDKQRKLDVTELECWLLVLWVQGSICFLLPSGQFCIGGKTGKLTQSSAEGRKNKQRMGFWIWLCCQPSHPFNVFWKWLALGVLA